MDSQEDIEVLMPRLFCALFFMGCLGFVLGFIARSIGCIGWYVG